MKTILDYTNFVNEMNKYVIPVEYKENNIVLEYLSGNIEDGHLDELLYSDLNDFLSDNGVLLEGINIKELLSKGKDAIVNWFFGALSTIIEKGKNAFGKVTGLLNSIYGVIKKFSNKHPELTKVLVVMIIIVALMVLSTKSALAGTGEPLTPQELEQFAHVIDATIGFLGDEMFRGKSLSSIQDVTNQLLKVKQNMLDPGSIDPSEISQQLVNTTKAAANYVNTFTDSEISDYAKKGLDFINKFGKVK